MEGVSSRSTIVSPLNHTASQAKDGSADTNSSSATFYSRSTCAVPIEPHQLNRQQLSHYLTSSSEDRLLQTSKDSKKCLTHRFQNRQYSKRIIEENREIKKKLNDILFDEFGVRIPSDYVSTPKLLQVTIHLISQIKNGINPIQVRYNADFFRTNNLYLNKAILGEELSRVQVNRKKIQILLDKIKDFLNVDLKRGNHFSQILSAAYNFLNNHLNQTSTSIEEFSEKIESISILPPGTSPSFNNFMTQYSHDTLQDDTWSANTFAPFTGLSIRQVPVNSTRVKKDHSKIIKYNKGLRIKKNEKAKELNDILFDKFGVININYARSKNKLIDATIFIIKKIKDQVEPTNIVYDIDYYEERSRQLMSSIKERGVLPSQEYRIKQDLLLKELNEVLDINIDAPKNIFYEQVLSAACEYLNNYLKQTTTPMEEASDGFEPKGIESTEPLNVSPFNCADSVATIASAPCAGLRETAKKSLPINRHSLTGVNPPRALDPKLRGDEDELFLPSDHLSTSQVPVNSTRKKREYSKKSKRNKELRIKQNQSSKELEGVLFDKFGVDIINYNNSKIKLIDATIFIIRQIQDQVNPINLVYDSNYFMKRSDHLISSIKNIGLSRYQINHRKEDILLRELKSILNIDATKGIGYEQIVFENIISEACNYLNSYLNTTSDLVSHYDNDAIHVTGSTQPIERKQIFPESYKYLNSYLNQTCDSTADSDHDVMPVLDLIQPVEPQPLSQSSIPLISLSREEELTTAEKSALIRLKNALNKYSIPEIDVDNFSELIFAAAYCTKMNSNMMLVSELDYNQHYLKHFHAPDPYNKPRDEIEYYLSDLEKILSEDSMDLAIDQYLNHQKETLPETGYLKNTEFDSCIDALEPEALPTTDSLNLPLENLEDEASSARAMKISAVLDRAAQYLENEEYIELQNLPANEDLPTYEDLSIYEDLIDDEPNDEPIAKKSKSNVTV